VDDVECEFLDQLQRKAHTEMLSNGIIDGLLLSRGSAKVRLQSFLLLLDGLNDVIVAEGLITTGSVDDFDSARNATQHLIDWGAKYTVISSIDNLVLVTKGEWISRKH
jgi:DNA-binding LacI/PurR family transcriptional regulator